MTQSQFYDISEFPPIFLIDKIEDLPDSVLSQVNLAAVDVDVFGEDLRIVVGYLDRQAKIADLILPARTLSTIVIEAVQHHLQENDIKIPCRKGCASCCRHLIAISPAEAYYFGEMFDKLDQDQKEAILAAGARTADAIMEDLGQITAPEPDAPESEIDAYSNKVSEWFMSKKYNELEMDCPFLSEQSCSIHELRPLICREWIVTGDEMYCRQNGVPSDNVVTQPLYVSRVLTSVCKKIEGSQRDLIIFPCAYRWYLENRQRADKNYPAKQLVDQFINTIKELAKK